MDRYRKAMDIVAKTVFVVTGILICAMVLIITIQVVGRFGFGKTPRWSEELTLVLMLFTGFLGASVAYRERLHIGIKVFLHMMNPRLRNRMYFMIDALVGVFSLFMLIWGTGFSWMMRNQTLPATKIKVGVSYMPIPIAGFILILFVVEKILKDIAERKSGASDSLL